MQVCLHRGAGSRINYALEKQQPVEVGKTTVNTGKGRLWTVSHGWRLVFINRSLTKRVTLQTERYASRVTRQGTRDERQLSQKLNLSEQMSFVKVSRRRVVWVGVIFPAWPVSLYSQQRGVTPGIRILRHIYGPFHHSGSGRMSLGHCLKVINRCGTFLHNLGIIEGLLAEGCLRLWKAICIRK